MALVAAYNDVTDVLVVGKCLILVDVSGYQIVHIRILCAWKKPSMKIARLSLAGKMASNKTKQNKTVEQIR